MSPHRLRVFGCTLEVCQKCTGRECAATLAHLQSNQQQPNAWQVSHTNTLQAWHPRTRPNTPSRIHARTQVPSTTYSNSSPRTHAPATTHAHPQPHAHAPAATHSHSPSHTKQGHRGRGATRFLTTLCRGHGCRVCWVWLSLQGGALSPGLMGGYAPCRNR